MGTSGKGAGATTTGLTARQQKWFDSVQSSLERDTGKTLDEWVAIARTCPESKPRARADWLRMHHGLGINRAFHVLGVAFPSGEGWDQPDKLRAALWTDPASLRLLEAVETAVSALPEVVTGQRKGFTAFSRKVQFAAVRPLKDGLAVLGLALTPDADPRLDTPRNESWSERLKAKLVLDLPEQVDGRVRALLRQAWERS
ncbi:DUF4287 domain-containing protein [Phenylobacterium sp. LH3H17]|uniref:DUF4287 domain-containing protein n=1 Tax=Phenylobacterium sp. LH3H17 TaxID=2903901 RepID=UPI0020C9D4F0|nr:DUF4287 domain-containing protein [Phenylobacterium sp. LH3H17]UTP41395.1 DUF4287 domain-containing protein [Phenylobacterium sp. LH3H17]